ncbi:MAG TPA: hypothetical protein VLA02_07195 [Reyranella sp.]|nr:hypothetical protein [Reyranella sp.]
MHTLLRGLVVVAVLFTASGAGAQSRSVPADLRYCWALSELYQRYVGNPVTETSSIRRNDAAAEAALAHCRQGNAAAAIPVLERKLLDNRFTLPARQ